VTVALGITLSVLDSAIANVALPTISHTLHISAASSVWVVNAYQLTITMSLLAMASLGDIIGHRRVVRFGLAMFTLGSLACALSRSFDMLVLARVAQGLGAAGIMSVSSAVVRAIYPSDMLGRGIAVNAVVVSVSAAIGPSVASAILSVAPWPWLFAVNVPIGLLTLMTARSLPRDVRSKARFDIRSAVLNALTFGLLISGVEGLGHGERPVAIGAELLVAVMAGVWLVRRQLSHPSPLLPVDLLRRPVFALSISTSICSFVAQMLAYVALPFYLQDVLGRSQVETGLLMTPWPMASILIAPVAGYLADRFPAGILGGLGLAAFAAGLGFLAGIGPHPSVFEFSWRMAVCGFGFALFQSPNNRAIMTSAPRRRSGGASGMLGMGRLLGQTTGAALAALLFGWYPERGATLALVVAACFASGAAVVSCLRLMRPQMQPED
jgi:DHA2 family multidrug resistance protein-like MFS transporter